MDKLGIPMPESMMASDIDGALKCAAKLGYPLIIRPSFVLGGRGMEVIFDEIMLREYVDKAVGVTPDRPLYLDRFLCHAMECEADALSDGKDIFIPAIMQHIELAGIHSGDSACVLPPVTIPEDAKATILDYTRRIAAELKVVGLMNMQFAIEDGKVYVIEANPRASRTVPLVSKVGGVQMAGIATKLMLGETVKSLGLDKRHDAFHWRGARSCGRLWARLLQVAGSGGSAASDDAWQDARLAFREACRRGFRGEALRAAGLRGRCNRGHGEVACRARR